VTDDPQRPAPDGPGRPRRRRRRRRGAAGAPGAAPGVGVDTAADDESDDADDADDAVATAAPAAAAEPAPGERRRRERRPDPREARDARPPRPEGRPAEQRGERRPPPDRPERGPRPDREARAPQPERTDRTDRPERGPRLDRGPQPERPDRPDRPDRGDRRERGRRDARPDRDARPRDERALPGPQPSANTAPPPPSVPSPAPAAPRRRPIDGDDEVEVDAEPRVAWGSDDDAPAPAITLAADLPPEPPAGDPDPATYDAEDASALLASDLANVVGVRFASAGRVYLFDAGDASYDRGERVIVEAERGVRLATVALPSIRRPHKERQLRRVLRRPTASDLRGETASDTRAANLLRLAKDRARAHNLPIKVFRIEISNNRVLLYFTSDDRVDLRDLLRDLGSAAGGRIELRQLGVRDEAKLVGGIGSCGQELCCTTWLPEFVPVSIKMAKDQGLVLNPTKVSGQCGRLKCCLVYEQATYAELRKGLPKLGKRVITEIGEGRVVEVDVLRQRVRVGYGPGESQVHAAGEVRPMFPPQGARPPGRDDSDTMTTTFDPDDGDGNDSVDGIVPAPPPHGDDDSEP
jgi:cell fate regulator YaaT (PSP1 superfamily)